MITTRSGGFSVRSRRLTGRSARTACRVPRLEVTEGLDAIAQDDSFRAAFGGRPFADAAWLPVLHAPDNISQISITEQGHVPDMYGAADRRPYGVALEGRLGQAYNEEAFRYFLEIERKRAARARRPVLLLLMDLKEQPAIGARIDPMLAAKLFSGLWLCLRETDVIGWYREDRVAGAVLNQLEEGPLSDVSSLIRQRVTGALCKDLSSDVARRLRVRVYHLRPGLKG